MRSKQDFCNDKCLSETSDELMIPSMLVKKIEKHWQLFTKKKIESGTFENIRIPYLIKFEFVEAKVRWMEIKKAKKQLNNTL